MSSKRVTDNRDGTVTVELKFPITLGERSIKTVTLRTTAMVPDLEAMDKGVGDIGKSQRLICELSSSGSGPGLPLSAFPKMRASDYLVLAAQAGKALSEEGDDEGSEGKESLQIGEIL